MAAEEQKASKGKKEKKLGWKESLVLYLHDLNKNGLGVFHCDMLLSQFPKFDTVGNEQRQRHISFGIVAGRQTELPGKGPGEGVHTAEA